MVHGGWVRLRQPELHLQNLALLQVFAKLGAAASCDDETEPSDVANTCIAPTRDPCLKMPSQHAGSMTSVRIKLVGKKFSKHKNSYICAFLIQNIARIANAVPVTLHSRVTMYLLILLFSIVRNVISVSSVKSQVISFLDCSKIVRKI